MSVRDIVAEETSNFRINNYKNPEVIYMSREKFVDLLKEDLTYSTAISAFPEAEPRIFGMKICFEIPKCHCGEAYVEGHKCLPCLVNGPPPLIRIV